MPSKRVIKKTRNAKAWRRVYPNPIGCFFAEGSIASRLLSFTIAMKSDGVPLEHAGFGRVVPPGYLTKSHREQSH
jgi:hypothetical protein